MEILTHLSWIKISIKTENMKKEGKIDFDGFWWSLFSIKLFIKIIAFIKIDFSFWCICVDFIKKKFLKLPRWVQKTCKIECLSNFWHSKDKNKTNKVYFSHLLIVIVEIKEIPTRMGVYLKREIRRKRKVINRKQSMRKYMIEKSAIRSFLGQISIWSKGRIFVFWIHEFTQQNQVARSAISNEWNSKIRMFSSKSFWWPRKWQILFHQNFRILIKISSKSDTRFWWKILMHLRRP